MPQTKRANIKTLKYKVLNFMLQIIHLLFIKNQKERQVWPEVQIFNIIFMYEMLKRDLTAS